MDYVDVDGDPATVNSSSAKLARAAGRHRAVRRPLLGRGVRPGRDAAPAVRPVQPRTGHAAANPAAAASAWLKAPGRASYVPVNATPSTPTPRISAAATAGAADERTRYQAFADVTSLVQAGGGGTLHGRQRAGRDRRRPPRRLVARRGLSGRTQPARNLTIFDGFAQVANGATTTIPVSGFRTPIDGDVNTQLGFVSYEGDINLAGDSLALNGTTLSDAAHPAVNFFDSGDLQPRLSRDGQIARLREPARLRRGRIRGAARASSRTTTRARTSSSPPPVTAICRASSSSAPTSTPRRWCCKKTVTDLNGGDVNPGDVLQYEISSTNTGRSSAYDARIDDAIPPQTSYQPGSLEIVASPGGVAGPKTDPTDADQAEFDTPSNAVRFRIGTGARGARAAQRRRWGDRARPVVHGALRRRRRRRRGRRHPDPQHRDPLEQGCGGHRLHLDRERARRGHGARRARRRRSTSRTRGSSCAGHRARSRCS